MADRTGTRGWPILPPGTVIHHDDDGITATRTGRRGDPFSWKTADGGEYGDEWARRAADSGATITTPEAGDGR